MDTKNYLKIFYALNFILISFASVEKAFREVNVLVDVFPPYTQVDSNQKVVSGIDVQILKTIAVHMNLKLNFIRTDSIISIPITDLEYVDFS